MFAIVLGPMQISLVLKRHLIGVNHKSSWLE